MVTKWKLIVNFGSLLLAGFLFFPLLARATDFSSTNFIVRDPVVSSGGVYSTSDTFRLYSSFGQTGIGKSTSDSRELRAGFLYFAAPSAAVSPSPTPTPTPTPGGGGPFLGPPGGPPGVQPPGPSLLPPLISFITGERVPPECVRFNRSDLNCDGEVDLQDLSILFSRPKVVSGPTLSLLFSDWTRRLPVPLVAPEIALRPTPRAVTPPPELAQVVSVVAPTTTPTTAKISIFRAIFNLLKTIVKLILRIFGL